jgi:hypothetical protein
MPRRKNDFYETPPHYLDALCSELDLRDTRVLDACVGEQAIADRLLVKYGATVITNDIDKARKADFHLDARNPKLYDRAKCDWWITNPPFNIIDDILYTALENVENVITLARLSVLEPTKGVGQERGRRELFKFYQPDMVIVLPRYCFRLNDKGKRATDSVTCAWVGWGPEVPRITTVWTVPPPDEAKGTKQR